MLGSAWYVFLAPSGLGGPVGVVWVSGTSMEPTMHTGDIAVVYRSDSYGVGDVVAFEIPGGGTVIHRITAADDGQYRFQGDNRDYTDPWRLGDDAIVGREIVTIPYAGTVSAFLGRPTSLALLAMALTLLWWFRRQTPEPASHPGGREPARLSPWDPPIPAAAAPPRCHEDRTAPAGAWPPPR